MEISVYDCVLNWHKEQLAVSFTLAYKARNETDLAKRHEFQQFVDYGLIGIRQIPPQRRVSTGALTRTRSPLQHRFGLKP